MKNSFVMPSGNYNIVLTEADIRELLKNGYISKNPTKTESIYTDECGATNRNTGHSLIYGGVTGEQPVQYIGICLDIVSPSPISYRQIKVGDTVVSKTGIIGVVKRFETPLVQSEEQTYVLTDDGIFHAPTDQWIKLEREEK